MASFRILTFGCKVNQCDSQILRETLTSWGLAETSLTEAGLAETGAEPEPDLVVINTCTVTGTADAKFRKALRRTRREHPRALIAVTGCHANKPSDSPSQLPGADVVFRMRDFSALADFLRRRDMTDADAAPSPRVQSYFSEHTRAFLKIQDGCDCFCAYCIVPIVRTKLWSEDPERVVAAINSLSSKGYREVVLTGIHLGFYGRDETAHDADASDGIGAQHAAPLQSQGRIARTSPLTDLLDKVERECEIERVRLSSIEISEVSDEMLELFARFKKLCHHLHLPLQSGDDEILGRMGRRYSSASFLQRIEEIRKRIPDVGFTTDVMVGFPGETDEQFERTCQAVEATEFAKIHVFRFSPRPGTRAAAMNSPVPPKAVSARARHLIRVGEDAARSFKRGLIGKTVHVLVEQLADDGSSCIGLASNYIRVKALNGSPDCVNRVLPVRLTGLDARTGIAIGQVI